jgi:Tfp pilus assembly protein PilO
MINLLKMTKKEKIVFYIAAVFVVLVFLDRLVYRAIRDMFGRLREKVLIEEKKVGANLRNLVQKDAVSAEYKKFSAYLAPVGTDEEEMSAFLKTVEETARSANIYVTDIKPQPTTNTDFYKKYIVEINAEAPLEQVMDFMHKLESLNQLISIEQLQLTAKKESSKALKVYIIVTKILIP